MQAKSEATVHRLHPAGSGKEAIVTNLEKFERDRADRNEAHLRLAELLIQVLRHSDGKRADGLGARFLRDLSSHDGWSIPERVGDVGRWLYHDGAASMLEKWLQLYDESVSIVSARFARKFLPNVNPAGVCGQCAHPTTWLLRRDGRFVTELCIRDLIRYAAACVDSCMCPVVEDEVEDRREDNAEFLRIQGAR